MLKGLVLCFRPLSQQYFSYIAVVNFIRGRKPEKTTDLHLVTDKLYRIIMYRVHLAMSGIGTHNVSGVRHWLHGLFIVVVTYKSDSKTQMSQNTCLTSMSRALLFLQTRHLTISFLDLNHITQTAWYTNQVITAYSKPHHTSAYPQ